MAAPRKPYLLTDVEAKIIDAMRDEEKNQNEGPQYTIGLTAWIGGYDFGIHFIDTRSIVAQVAEAGVDFHKQFLSGAWSRVEEIHDHVSGSRSGRTDEAEAPDHACVSGGEENPEARSVCSEKASDHLVHVVEHQSPENVAEIPTMVIGRYSSSDSRPGAQSSPSLPKPACAPSLPEVGLAKLPLTDSITMDDIINYADSIGYTLETRDKIRCMYAQWIERGIIEAFRKEASHDTSEEQLQRYYLTLVDFYILATHLNLKDLAYKILLTFQATNYAERGSIPHIETAVKTFQYLSITSPLCRWISILYAFLWSTRDGGTYTELRQNNEDMQTEALARFLHGIALIRCEFTPGHDISVLDRWCEVHEHKVSSKEQRMCEENKIKYNDFLENAKQAEKEVELEAARELLQAADEKLKPRKRASISMSNGGTKRPAKKRSCSNPLENGEPPAKKRGRPRKS